MKRYKRFLADIQVSTEEKTSQVLTVHCPNPGSMRGCSTPGSPVLISDSANPKRKYRWTLEMVQNEGVWIGVNTSKTNRIVREGLEQGRINAFTNILAIRQEVRVSDKSRLDFLLQTEQGEVYMEVKNCSLARGTMALFPDAVTTRGTKHINELIALTKKGFQTALLFCIQRGDVTAFTPAEDIDPVYAQTLRQAYEQGVRILAYKAKVSPLEISLQEQIPYQHHL